jgi:VanZ family protein
MDDVLDQRTYVRVTKLAVICVVCVLLAAGLWPFHAPQNDVAWCNNGDGLCFGRHGSALSAGGFLRQPDKSVGSIEVWLEPSSVRGEHTILSFDSSEHPGAPFALRQLGDRLIVQQDNEDTNGNSWTAWSVIDGAFHATKPIFATIILGPQHTSIYLDGISRKDFFIGESWNNFTGMLVVANSPSSNDSWSGTIKGLAIYNRQLTTDEVSEHYESWVRDNRPALSPQEVPTALYLFNEREGDTVYNEFGHGTDLKIPSSYFVLHAAFLESPWSSYHPSSSYWKDVALNVLGFIPLGFFATAHFSSTSQTKRAMAIALVLGFLTSFTIESLQTFLPTRDSGMNDLITNTMGTAVGAMLCVCLRRSSLLTTLIGVSPSKVSPPASPVIRQSHTLQ